ncbi:MAG: prolyl oligopeptidase family serine peptidase [Gemmatimonadaceae bacterium]
MTAVSSIRKLLATVALRTTAMSFSLVLIAAPLAAQNAGANTWNPQEILKTETFVKPPADVERMIMAPRTDISFTMPNADRSWFLRGVGDDRGDIMAYGKPHLYLGGLQVDTKANRARSLTTSTRHSLVLINSTSGATRNIETPKGATISAQVWSPTGTQIAYIANFDDASYPYVADAATGKSVQVSKVPLLATLNTELDWTADGKSLVTVIVPAGRGAEPLNGINGVDDGPQVRLTNSRAIPQAVHASLLATPHDKALLKFYTTGQLAIIDVKAKTIRKIGTPRMIRSVDLSPDAQNFRVTVMTEPFSYLVPVSTFGSVQELWDATGKNIATLSTTGLRDGEVGDGDAPPAGGRGAQASPSDTGKRNVQWNPVGQGLVFLQSVFNGAASNDGAAAAPAGRGGRAGAAGGRGGAAGRGGNAAAARTPTSVRYMNWVAPFGASDMKVIYEGGPQLSNVAYSADGKTMFVSDSGSVIAMHTADMSKRYSLGRVVTLPGAGGFGGRGGGGGALGGLGGGNADTTVLGGALAMKRGPNGQQFVIVGTDGKTVAVSGTRAPGANWSTQSPRPWLDKMNFETGQRTRIFDSPTNAFEEFVTPLDDDYSKFIYTHESATVIADAYLRDAVANSSKKITNNKDVGPEVTGAQVKRIQVARPRDGYKFWVDVTLPKDWKTGTKLPGIIWFYPREFTTQAEYDRSRYNTNINKFPDIPALRPASSTKLWVSQGYALIEPDIPIFGDTGKMNDNYTRDLRENLDAVLDAVVEQGFVDRDKMGIGGHSYGAFSTVNAMTLVPYFKAGIAGDGMYNRSLTPFGFQSERRNFYQAQSTYLDMSPFFRADKISGALLMYHAKEDQNQGTSPISSERMMAALQGLGKPAAFYLYSYEDHSDATYATDLDLWARWLAWFDVYVKNPKSDKKAFTP